MFMGLMAMGGRLLQKKLHHRAQSGGAPASGLTAGEEQDLGFDNTPVATSTASTGTGVVPFRGGPGLGMIQTKPTMVSRAKCPHGYSSVRTGGTDARPTVTCVLTKVARALGLVHRKRGRGISARDLRAAVRVQRLVHRLGPKFGVHRGRGGHGAGCACPRCRRK